MGKVVAVVEVVYIDPHNPCTFCGTFPPRGGLIPDISKGAQPGDVRPCPVCNDVMDPHRVTECATCGDDGLVELPEDEGAIVAGYLAEGLRHDPRTGNELVTMLPCPDCCYRAPGDKELPSDYETCGDCGFDHDYEPEVAAAWHTNNPGSYPWEVVTVKLHGSNYRPDFEKMYEEAGREVAREQLVQALIQHTGDESHSRDLVGRIERREAWLFILYPDYMHDMVDMLFSIG